MILNTPTTFFHGFCFCRRIKIGHEGYIFDLGLAVYMSCASGAGRGEGSEWSWAKLAHPLKGFGEGYEGTILGRRTE